MNTVARFDVAVTAVMVVAVIVVVVKPSFGVVEEAPTSDVLTVTPATDVTRRSPLPIDGPDAIAPGSYVIPWPHTPIDPSVPRTSGMKIHLDLPAGWRATDDGTGIGKDPEQPPFLRLQVHDVASVVANVCDASRSIDAGSTVDDLVAALARQEGSQPSQPVHVLVGGLPAKKLSLRPHVDGTKPCREGVHDYVDVWSNDQGPDFGMIWGGRATVYVVDVSGERVVVTTWHRNASAAQRAELDAIMDSIEIVPIGEESLIGGRYSLAVDGAPFSFTVPALVRDQGWNRYGLVYLSKDTVGSQSAEAAIYWTGLPAGAFTKACGTLLALPADPSVTDVVAALLTAPGTELVAGPMEVTVGGRVAKHMELRVHDAVGCDPGYFHAWVPAPGGPGWWTTEPGSTIRVWIVDVNGKAFLIAGLTTPEAGLELEREVEDIVDSIEFE